MLFDALADFLDAHAAIGLAEEEAFFFEELEAVSGGHGVDADFLGEAAFGGDGLQGVIAVQDAFADDVGHFLIKRGKGRFCHRKLPFIPKWMLSLCFRAYCRRGQVPVEGRQMGILRGDVVEVEGRHAC